MRIELFNYKFLYVYADLKNLPDLVCLLARALGGADLIKVCPPALKKVGSNYSAACLKTIQNLGMSVNVRFVHLKLFVLGVLGISTLRFNPLALRLKFPALRSDLGKKTIVFSGGQVLNKTPCPYFKKNNCFQGRHNKFCGKKQLFFMGARAGRGVRP